MGREVYRPRPAKTEQIDASPYIDRMLARSAVDNYPIARCLAIIGGVKERIQKILASAGIASRRQIEEMVETGRVTVNGTARTRLPIMIDSESDRVEVDGELVKLRKRTQERRLYILMHKPKHVYTTNVAQGEQTRAIDLLPPTLRTRVYPVGQLEAETRGLLLLTNDGDLTNRLTHPRFGVAKTYRATVDGFVEPETIQALEQPGTGRRGPANKATIRVAHRSRLKSVLEITLREGKNRELRKLLAKAGHKVKDLARIKIGPLDLHGLKPGDSRALSPRELRDLTAWIDRAEAAAMHRKTKGDDKIA